MEDRCICCGAIIPEGRQVCESCERGDRKFSGAEHSLEFVSYSGEYPNLCRGELVLRIDGELVNLGWCLCSGGGFSEDYTDIYSGDWSVDLPIKYQHLEKVITDIVNENVVHGCCGGCV